MTIDDAAGLPDEELTSPGLFPFAEPFRRGWTGWRRRRLRLLDSQCEHCGGKRS